LAATDGAAAATQAGRAYAEFLEVELNLAYQGLLSRMSEGPRRRLAASQREWLRWRAAERRFIDLHWTRESRGSSATLSAAQHRNALTRQRVLQLLNYMAEYP
jgi:uncharacterized protein YecT (DUF1311 family)